MLQHIALHKEEAAEKNCCKEEVTNKKVTPESLEHAIVAQEGQAIGIAHHQSFKSFWPGITGTCSPYCKIGKEEIDDRS